MTSYTPSALQAAAGPNGPVTYSGTTVFHAPALPAPSAAVPSAHPGQNITSAPPAPPKNVPKSALSKTPAVAAPSKQGSALQPDQNYYPKPAGARRPRAFMLYNGKKISLLSLETTSTAHFTPDSWSGTISLYNQPQGIDLAFWAKADPTTLVELHLGILDDTQGPADFPNNSTSILTGQVDDIKPSLDKGIVSLTGRDLTARFVDNRTAERNSNQTASEIVTRWAQLYGLTPQVTKTTTPVGKYTDAGYSSMNAAQPYWDLITFYAQQENFDAYVSGTTLYFGPSQADVDTKPWTIYLQTDGQGRLFGNVLTMELGRSANIAKDISVTVMSHSSAHNRSFSVHASRSGTYIGNSSRNKVALTTQSYVIRKPGLTEEQATNMANAMLAQISKFEKTYVVTIEGDVAPNMMSVRKMTKIIGTNTPFDGKYYPRSIARQWSAETGYTMTVNARNLPAENESSSG